MNKKEYKEKLEVILDLHNRNFKNLCNAWYIRDFYRKRYALYLYIFVELLILKGFCKNIGKVMMITMPITKSSKSKTKPKDARIIDSKPTQLAKIMYAAIVRYTKAKNA